MVSKRYDVSGFSKITASHACQLRVVPSAVYGLTVTCDDNLLSYVEVETNGPDAVSIELREGHGHTRVTFTAEVHLPVLAAL
jgi:hypothetical protein